MANQNDKNVIKQSFEGRKGRDKDIYCIKVVYEIGSIEAETNG